MHSPFGYWGVGASPSIFEACVGTGIPKPLRGSSESGSPSVWPSRPSCTRAPCTVGWRSSRIRRPVIKPRTHTAPARTLFPGSRNSRVTTVGPDSAAASATATTPGRCSSRSLCLQRPSRRFRPSGIWSSSATSRLRSRRIGFFLFPTAHPALPLARSRFGGALQSNSMAG